MVEILTMLGEYLTGQSGLPHTIQPAATNMAEPHFSISPDNLDIQILKTLDTGITNSLQIIGINLDITLESAGTDLVWLDTVFQASILANELFAGYFCITLGESRLGFSVAVEKERPGTFNRNQDSAFPFTYTESWKAQVILKRGGITYGQSTQSQTGSTAAPGNTPGGGPGDNG